MSSEIKTRVVKEARIEIGSEHAHVSRDGDNITINYPYAGRVTRETERFYADDIRRLAKFVEDTDVE